MKLTVSEALELRKDIALKVSSLTREVSQTSCVEITQNGVITNPIVETFQNQLSKLNYVLECSCELNDKIARFNIENNIDSTVRQKKNLQIVEAQLKSAIQKCVSSKNKKFEIVGNERLEILIEQKPIVDVDWLKKELSATKKKINQLQSSVHVANTKEIEVNFEENSL